MKEDNAVQAFYHTVRSRLGRLHKNEREKRNDAYVNGMDLDHVPLPVEVEIETINRCNGICPFCPVNANQPQRPYAKMTEELFKKIIAELKELDYRGNCSLYSNNEPFLDERIIEWQKYAREQLPNASWRLFTNGSLMTLDKFKEIIPCLDLMTIDNYSDEGKWTPAVQIIYDYVEAHPEWKDHVHFWMRKQNETLNSRGGQAPNKKNRAVRSYAKCALPFQEFIIRPTGEVSLCTADALGKYTFGDLNRNTIREIWYSDKYAEVRREMKKNGRKNLELCSRCDQVGGEV
ncbi:MAG: SPASM domain-containing protein [Lachnospiraceae bacterium]|nr:SPASM domain-containing protein [Lachnospiraceae bacterium]